MAGAREARPAVGFDDLDIDRMSDALAVGLTDLGMAPGDRVAVSLPDIPQLVIAELAIRKAGGIMVSVDPMVKASELEGVLTDSAASILVCLESFYASVAKLVVPGTSLQAVITTCELGSRRHRSGATHDLIELIDRHTEEDGWTSD